MGDRQVEDDGGRQKRPDDIGGPGSGDRPASRAGTAAPTERGRSGTARRRGRVPDQHEAGFEHAAESQLGQGEQDAQMPARGRPAWSWRETARARPVRCGFRRRPAAALLRAHLDQDQRERTDENAAGRQRNGDGNRSSSGRAPTMRSAGRHRQDWKGNRQRLQDASALDVSAKARWSRYQLRNTAPA